MENVFLVYAFRTVDMFLKHLVSLDPYIVPILFW